MDEFRKSSFREQTLGLADTALIDGIIRYAHAAKDAMSQSAAMGNLEAARIYEEELQTRARQRDDHSLLDTLQERLMTELNFPKR